MRRRHFLLLPLLSPLSLGAAGRPDYPTVRPGVPLVLPRDHGAHPDFRHEWWYVTGALRENGGGGEPTGFQLTFFRTRPGFAEDLASPLAARQIVFAHAAFTRPGVGLRHAERAARAGLGAGFASTDCDVYVGSWRLFRADAAAMAPFRLVMHDAAFAFDLSLHPTQPPWPQGDGGYSRKGPLPAQASFYLSWPQLAVDGALTVDGRRRTVAGRAWFDHEWSSEPLSPDSVGWDWLGANLDDGGALVAFRLRDGAGRTVFAHAALREADGRSRSFAADDISFTPRRHWRSPQGGAPYPVEIDLRCGELAWTLRPAHDAQEIAGRRPRPIRYWEGLVEVAGARRGRGYLELTGYAEPLRL